jgi:hypothetical protein
VALDSGWRQPASERVEIGTHPGTVPLPTILAMTNTAPALADFNPCFAVDAQQPAARMALRVAGEVDLCSAPRLAAELTVGLTAGEPAGEVVDDLVLAHPSAMLRRLLSVTGLAEVFCVVGEA